MNIPFYSDIDLKNNKIKNVGTPVDDSDVSNKSYVDNGMLNLHTEISGEIAEEVDTLGTRITNLDNGIENRIDTEIESNIVDNLTTADATKILSANQGFILQGKITEVADSIINNNYATEPTIIGTYLNLPYYRITFVGDIIKNNEEPGPATRYIRLSYNYDGTGQIRNMFGSYILNYQPEINDEFIVRPMFLGKLESNFVEENVAITGAEYFGNTLYVNFDLGNTIFTLLDTYSPLHYEISVEFTLNIDEE